MGLGRRRGLSQWEDGRPGPQPLSPTVLLHPPVTELPKYLVQVSCFAVVREPRGRPVDQLSGSEVRWVDQSGDSPRVEISFEGQIREGGVLDLNSRAFLKRMGLERFLVKASTFWTESLLCVWAGSFLV